MVFILQEILDILIVESTWKFQKILKKKEPYIFKRKEELKVIIICYLLFSIDL